jgi:hypothetical protein
MSASSPPIPDRIYAIITGRQPINAYHREDTAQYMAKPDLCGVGPVVAYARLDGPDGHAAGYAAAVRDFWRTVCEAQAREADRRAACRQGEVFEYWSVWSDRDGTITTIDAQTYLAELTLQARCEADIGKRLRAWAAAP